MKFVCRCVYAGSYVCVGVCMLAPMFVFTERFCKVLVCSMEYYNFNNFFHSYSEKEGCGFSQLNLFSHYFRYKKERTYRIMFKFSNLYGKGVNVKLN